MLGNGDLGIKIEIKKSIFPQIVTFSSFMC